MSGENRRTIRTYQSGVQTYIEGTPQMTSGAQRRWIDGAFADIDKSARVLEVGSAFGRDAAYLKRGGGGT